MNRHCNAKPKDLNFQSKTGLIKPGETSSKNKPCCIMQLKKDQLQIQLLTEYLTKNSKIYLYN
jgi:hypothetical protein